MSEDRRPIRALLFDVDGTLYHAPGLRRRMALSLLLRSALDLRLARRRIKNLQAWRHALEALRCETREQIQAAGGLRARQAALALERGAFAESLDEDVTQWMAERPLGFLLAQRRRGILEFVQELAQRGIRCGVWSDYAVDEKLRVLGLSALMEPRLSADDPQIDCLKPWPRGFVRAAELWGLPSSEILYVGDRPDVDAVGASAAGMRVAIFEKRRKASAGDTGYWSVCDVAALRSRLLGLLSEG